MQKIEELLNMSEDELHMHYNEGDPRQASQEVRDAYSAFDDALEEYLAAVAVSSFADGFLYAVSLMKEGATK